MIPIIADPKVRHYELTFLLQAGLTSAEVKKIAESLVEILTKHQMTVSVQQDWGKKELAYTLKYGAKKQTEALYHHWVITGPASAMSALEKDLTLFHSFMRYLLVVADSQVGKEGVAIASDAKSESKPATKKTATRSKTTSASKTKAKDVVAVE